MTDTGNLPDKKLSAFVSFPSPYTQSLLVQALVATIPSLSLSLAPFPEAEPPALQWADYDLMSFDKPHAYPTSYQISSYIYRKALIRKHQLQSTIIAYLAKCQHRNIESVLNPQTHGGIPKGWNVEIQFADELDELLVDDLYELGEGMRDNEGKEDGEKRWWILKPGFADRAQGIRMFSTEDELRAIFESFEPSSSDEEDYEDEDDDHDDEDVGGKGADEHGSVNGEDGVMDLLVQKAVELGFTDEDDERGNDQGDEDNDEDEEGTGVMTSQLRHFVIQEYMPRPVLFDIAQQAHQPRPRSNPRGYKFHLRAYVLVTGGYTVHLARTMLALFSGSPYTHPSSSDDELDLRPHLTNTCLQTDAYGAPTPPEELVKLFWELEGLSALSANSKGDYEEKGTIDRAWLDGTFAKCGEVVAEAVKAGAECGSFGLQFMPNAFEIFGVDLILSFPESASSHSSPLPRLPIPTVTLLEFNASPDFHQSGDRLRPDLLEMFKGVIRISVAPFFGLSVTDDEDDHEDASHERRKDIGVREGEKWEVGEEKWGWRLIGQGEIRGSGW
ncbi:cytoplasmic protein [Kwoniella heveanensis CBS 569]|nr:cytoplasmic protein [Kwoniella heveanensis CBS 569]